MIYLFQTVLVIKSNRKDCFNMVKRLNEADSAKLLASYSTELFWYDEITRKNEDSSLLKKFINNRIKYNLNKKLTLHKKIAISKL